MSDAQMWTAAPAVLGLLGLFFLVLGLRQLMRGRVFLSLTTAVGGLALACLGLIIGVFGSNVLAYSRLTYERPLAEVSVAAAGPVEKTYAVTVHPETAPPTVCTVQGDQWLLSVKVQTWKPWTTVLGFDATYTLDQLANKYADAAEANGKPITACALTGGDASFAPYIPPGLRAWVISNLQVSDRNFGAANFMPLADGALYRVTMTQQGPVAEPANDAARAAAANFRMP